MFCYSKNAYLFQIVKEVVNTIDEKEMNTVVVWQQTNKGFNVNFYNEETDEYLAQKG